MDKKEQVTVFCFGMFKLPCTMYVMRKQKYIECFRLKKGSTFHCLKKEKKNENLNLYTEWKCMWHVIDRSELLLVDNLDRGNKNIKFTCTEKYKLARERKEECFNSLAYSRTISLHRWVSLLKSQNL